MAENRCVKRLAQLREAMRREHVDALIIPTADYHGSEYVAECFRARQYYSGFSGSAGTLLVMADRAGGSSLLSDGAGEASASSDTSASAGNRAGKASVSSDISASVGNSAALWTDGRYFIQAAREIEGSGITLMKMGMAGVPTLRNFLQRNLPAGSTLAFDGRCMTAREGGQLRKSLRARKITVRSDLDLAGSVWEDRPALPSHPVWILDADRYAGETAPAKLARLRERMSQRGASAYVSGKLDEIMWLYNLRGNDVECNPVALSYTVVTPQAALLYLQESEVTDEVREYLKEIGAELHPYEEFLGDLEAMRFDVAAKADCGAAAEAGEGAAPCTCPLPDPEAVRIWYDPDSASDAIAYAVQKNLIHLLGLDKESEQVYVNAVLAEHLVGDPSPLDAMKAVRNETEIRNFRSCYLEDSAVLTKFIFRLKKAVKEGAELSERQAADLLDGMRAEISDFVELSFGTISAYGSNAAMMHYDPGAGGAVLKPEGMYLVDSGGHYLRGTTDVTRTFALGPVTEEMRRDYTLTALSQLQMMDTVFLKGCNGVALDIMAREPMWARGMDYKCGTGHGIGYLLNVHEGPQSLRYHLRSRADKAPFEPGMIVSDEPGVYKEGQYGIRIETILLCRKWGETPDGEFLCFEPITFVPLDPELLDPSVLTPAALSSLNRYHRQVYEKLAPFMKEDELQWLAEQCAAI